MVFRSQVAHDLGDFDLDLGVGARLNGSEDNDYSLRAFAVFRWAHFLPQPAIGHRDRNTAIRAKCYRSGLMVIARHARRLPALRSALLRKLAVCSALMARGELKPTAFVGVVRTAAGELRGAGDARSEQRP
ncbi:hypothetical protein [Aureimonas phyllosphaerae]|uniref:Uncharacterized protein n=1 Tax=Aureimonas phyllosphaerae TaxID=1166078 RepID=A0A7W6BU26_9HYPH|nr:hypothetical protein [Aureimonas phyllosphaerae]MBB3938029.1 hypothetical protein [Aureimonas phyllosphaerae]MBB3962036.1 hypothetical protein [Aureimonas phyllosphaerae]SFF54110.1 hypothetical protein SAMN05216566_12436 [Aureimonas phyllosphaerae]